MGITDFSIGDTEKYPTSQLVMMKNLTFHCPEKDRKMTNMKISLPDDPDYIVSLVLLDLLEIRKLEIKIHLRI